MPIRTVLFDLGNVLVYFSHERMFRQLAALAQRSPEDVEEFLMISGLMVDYDTGAAGDADFHRRFQEWSGQTIAMNDLLQAGGDIFWLNTPMPSLLSQLRQAGYRLVLLSNTCPPHIASVRRQWPTLLDSFDELVLSYEAGAMKPDPKIYQAAARAIHCEPSECFYTDDIPLFVETARAHGFNAEVFTGAERLIEHLNGRGVKLNCRN